MIRLSLLLAALLAAAQLSAALLSAPLATPAWAQDQNPSFNLVNRGASAIRQLYVTPAGDARWGENRLGGGTIARGASFAVRRRIDGNCVFDIRAVFTDGHTEDRRGLNTCTLADVEIGTATTAPTAAPTPAPGPRKAADDPSFRLANRGPQPITELFAAPAGLADRGENRLGGTALSPGAEREILIPRQGTCLFDLRVVFADHTAKEKHRADLCRLTTLPVP